LMQIPQLLLSVM